MPRAASTRLSDAFYTAIIAHDGPSVRHGRALLEIEGRARYEARKALGLPVNRSPRPLQARPAPAKLQLVPAAAPALAPRPLDYSPQAIAERLEEFWDCYMGPKMAFAVAGMLRPQPLPPVPKSAPRATRAMMAKGRAIVRDVADRAGMSIRELRGSSHGPGRSREVAAVRLRRLGLSLVDIGILLNRSDATACMLVKRGAARGVR